MNKKNSKKKRERAIALVQIFIMSISIFTLSYFIGEEIKFVGADAASDLEAMTKYVAGTTTTGVSGTGVAQSAIGTTTTSIPDYSTLISNIPTPVSSSTATSAAEWISAADSAPIDFVSAADTITPYSGYDMSTTMRTPVATNAMWESVGIHVASLAINAGIAVGLYVGGKILGESIFGEGSPVAERLGQSIALGYGLGSLAGIIANIVGGSSGGGFLASTLGFGPIGLGGGLVGLGLGLTVWFFTAQNARIDTVIFTCSPWLPKTGGEDCEKCNRGVLPCTEYKCKSLGNCELINKGTTEELCTHNDRNDLTAPTISSWSGPLKEKFSYTPESATLPASGEDLAMGVTINYADNPDRCIPPFTMVPYGISLNKPGKCKADLVRKNSFEEMTYDLSNGYYLYNHTLMAFSPGLSATEKEGIEISNGGKYEIFIRCENKNKFSNTGTFVFKFCAQSQPDTSAPKIPLTEPANGMPVSYGKTSQEAIIYTDKPSDCKWSHKDEDYIVMANTMTCAQSITEIESNMLYKCTTTLDGLKDDAENKFYIKCKSYPNNEESDRYANEESYVYTLLGTNSLVIDSIEPVDESVIKDSTENVLVTLKAQTSAGYKDGQAWCSYNETSKSNSGNYVLFANTDSYLHSQDLWLEEGNYRYSIKCCDLGGNCKTELTEFEVETDNDAPVVVRVYNEAKELKIVTNEKSNCVYDILGCSYNFDDGIKITTNDNVNHYLEWDTGSNFYIKCKDEYGNKPISDKCSVIARPFSSY